MTTNRTPIDLSNSTVSLIGACFSNVLDRIDINTLRSNHTAGVMLIDELRRAGFSIARNERYIPLSIRRPALRLCVSSDPQDAVPDDPTLELPAFLRPQAE